MKGVLTRAFAKASDIGNAVNFALFRLLFDQDYLLAQTGLPAQKRQKLSNLFRTVETSAFRFCSRKAATNDFTPKPVVNILQYLALEAQLALRPMLPVLSRSLQSPIFLTTAAAMALTYFCMNDANTQMIADSINQWIATLSGEHGSTPHNEGLKGKKPNGPQVG